MKLKTLLTAGLWLGGAVAQQRSEEDPFTRVESGPHRVEKPYLDKYFQNRYYDYGGSTFIKSDSFIRLTSDVSDQRGWLVSKLPSLPESFQIEFDFQIHGQGNTIYGDGMAFWIFNERNTEEGPVFGLKDYFKGIGILFDTYKNDGPGKVFPYVMLMEGDGQTTYDKDHDGAANEIVACSARGLHNARQVSKARLTYSKDQFLSLELDYKGRNKWEKCFETSQVQIKRPAFLGFSAQTGELSENHDLYEVRVYSLKNPPISYGEVDYYQNGNKNADIRRPTDGSKASSSGSWAMFSLKFVMFIFVAVGVYFATATYRAHARKKQEQYYL
jgi:mannose-binding lectin 2